MSEKAADHQSKQQAQDGQKTIEAIERDIERQTALMQTPEHAMAVSRLMAATEDELRDALRAIYEGAPNLVNGILQRQGMMPPAVLLPLEKASQLRYPCLVSAFLDYFATGEGRTMGVLLMHAHRADEIKRAVVETWGDYFSVGVQVREWQGVPPGFEAIDPNGAVILMQDMSAEKSFQYAALLHYNLT